MMVPPEIAAYAHLLSPFEIEAVCSHAGRVNPQGRPLSRKMVTLRASLYAVMEDIKPRFTVRQIYYQAEVRELVDKTEAGYRQVQRQLLEMRREGVIPYRWIADNTRWRIAPKTYGSVAEFIEHHRRLYRADIWQHANTYVEVWVEKDAMQGVLYPITGRYGVALMPARGFSSETFAHQAVAEMAEIGKRHNVVLHFGDLDPSGWDASRDLAERLAGFAEPHGIEIDFRRVLVHASDIEPLNLPTRPTKLTDTRTKAFFREFGEGHPSCELDAVHPDKLRQILDDEIRALIPADALHQVEVEEAAADETLAEIQRVLPQFMGGHRSPNR